MCLVLGPSTAHAQSVRKYVSSAEGERLKEQKSLRFGKESKARSGLLFKIDDSKPDQTIIGFGASFLEAGMECLNSLPAAKKQEVLRSLFSQRDGAGFSAMKTVIGATDFMSAGSFYTYDDTPGDLPLAKFSIQRDLQSNGLIPFIKSAQRYGHFVLEAPMDYPPDWMLFDVNSNQDVAPKYYDALSRYYARYLQDYQKNGIEINYLSLFNEPSIYTKIPYEQIRDLLADHVGPLFLQLGIKARLQMAEAPSRAQALDEYPKVLDDPKARKFVSALPYHGYDFTAFKAGPIDSPKAIRVEPTKENGYNFSEFQAILALHRRYPDLPLWMTEVCLFNFGTPWAKPLPRLEFEYGDLFGRQIFADVKAGASGWIYWNMILDQDGGPELISPVHRDSADNKQQPLVVINRQSGEVSFTGAYYYLAHFSKFVRPGYVRLEVLDGTKDFLSSIQADVQGLAFKGPNGAVVAELINSKRSTEKVRINWRDREMNVELPAQSITTLTWK